MHSFHEMSLARGRSGRRNQRPARAQRWRSAVIGISTPRVSRSWRWGCAAIGAFLNTLGPGLGVELARLCDVAEEATSGVPRAGRLRVEPHALAHGIARLLRVRRRPRGRADPFARRRRRERVIDAQGDLGPFRTFQKQPAWRGRPARRSSSGASSVRTAAGRSSRLPCSSMRWTSRVCRGRWMACSLMSSRPDHRDVVPVVRGCSVC